MRHVIYVFIAAVAATLLVSAAGTYYVWHSLPASADTVIEEDDWEESFTGFDLPENQLPTAEFSTTTYDLHPAPVELYARIKGDPKVKPDEISFRLPVLMYHHIRPLQSYYSAKQRRYTVTPQAFEAQMIGLMRAGYHAITPDDLDRALSAGLSVLPAKPFLLTFDDGNRDQYINAFPILKKLNLPATFFLVSRSDRSRGSLDDGEIREIDRSGLATIAAHTRHHVFLARMSVAAQDSEIAGSKADLEKIIDHPVTAFSYPFGSWSDEVVKQVETAGFRLAFGVRLGSLHAPSSRYQLRRIQVQDSWDLVPLLDRFSQP